MSKFSGHDLEGNRVIGIGLLKKTYAKLLEGEVLVYDLKLFGIHGVKLMIVAGRDDPEITRHLQHSFNSRTNVHLPAAGILHGEK